MGLNFSFYEYMKRLSEKYLSSIDSIPSSFTGNLGVILKNGLCGAVAGGASKFLVYPLDTLKRRMQIQVLSNTLSGAIYTPRYNNAWQCFASTLKNEGVGGFYKVLEGNEYNSLTRNSGHCSHCGKVCAGFWNYLCGVRGVSFACDLIVLSGLGGKRLPSLAAIHFEFG